MSTTFKFNASDIIAPNGNFTSSLSVSGLLTATSGNFSTLQVNGTGVSVGGHTHAVSDITNFNSSVSGLLPVKNITAGSGIIVSDTSGSFTISASGGGGGGGTTISNFADNRVLTSDGTSTGIVAETGLVFDGTKLGIGTSSPSVSLDVSGSGRFTNIDINNSAIAGTSALTVNGSISTQNQAVIAGQFSVYGDQNTRLFKPDTSTFAMSSANSGIAHSFGYTLSGTHVPWVTINNTGVGIGTSTPSGRLDLSGDAYIRGSTYYTTSINETNTSCRIYSVASGENRLHLDGGSNSISLWGNAGKLILQSSSVGTEIGSTFPNAYVMFNPGTTEKARITPSGFLGIGTSAPSGHLHVIGSGFFSGRVGIGTGVQALSPTESLVVDGNIRLSDTAGNRIQLHRGGGTVYDYSISKEGNHLALSTAEDGTTFRNVQIGYHSSNGTWNPKTIINGWNGSVGIGITTPSGQLHVLGTGLFSSRVGIGTNSPSSFLDVRSSGNPGLILQSNDLQNIIQYLKTDGTNLLRAYYDGSNFHHVFGSNTYYNFTGGDGIVFNGGGGSSTNSLSLNNRFYISCNSSTTAAPGNANIWGGPNLYATTGTQLTSISPIAFTTWAWNGSDGYSLSTSSYFKQTQLSANNGDARLGIVRASDNTEVLSINYLNGRVGIGNTSPSYALDVTGSGYFSSGIRVGSSTTNGFIYGPSGNIRIHLNQSTNNILFDSSVYADSAVSISTQSTNLNSPGIYVNGTLAFPKTSTATSTASQANPNTIIFYNSFWNGSAAFDAPSSIESRTSTTVNGASRLAFFVQPGDGTWNTVERLSITSNGRVGVNNTNPSYALDVVGTGNFSQNLLVNGTGVSLTGHTHTASNITDFNSSVSGLVNGVYAPLTGTLNQFGSTSSSQLASVISDETGTGLLVFNTSPAFSGTPTVPTASSGTNTTQIASTAFVRTEISNLVASAPSALDTLNELAAALGNDANFSTTVTNNLAGKANNTVTITAGSGLTGGGDLSANRSLDIGQGDGVTVSADSIAVNSTVVRTTGSQTISATHTFSGATVFGSNVTTSGNLTVTAQTASTIAGFDASKNVTSLSTATYPSLTELSYVKGVTSAIQTQLGNKADTSTTITAGSGLAGGGSLAANRSIDIGQGDGISVSADSIAVDSTVVRTTGSQTISATHTFTGATVFGSNVTTSGNLTVTAQTASTIAGFDASKNVTSLSTATYPSLTELSYVKGVTSAIQTQLGNKANSTVTITAGSGIAGGGDLSANRSLDIGQGDGITVSADSIAVNSTVVRTTGSQTISATHTFSANTIFSTGVTVSGDLSARTLISTLSSGSEGGEIQLAKPATGSSISGNVTIDVWNNRLRIFESNSPTKGYFLDLLGGADGVATPLKTKTIASFSASDNMPPAASFATLDTRNSIMVLDFDAGLTELAIFPGLIPDSANLASGLTVNINWMATTATSGNCVWRAEFKDMDDDLDSITWGTAVTGISTANGTNGTPSVATINLSAAQTDGLVAGDFFLLRIARSGDHISDTMLGDAELINLEVETSI